MTQVERVVDERMKLTRKQDAADMGIDELQKITELIEKEIQLEIADIKTLGLE